MGLDLRPLPLVQAFAERLCVQWPFLDVLARSFGAGLREVDYRGATERARAAINAWTAERTHDRIEEIIGPGGVDAAPLLVLVDALYF